MVGIEPTFAAWDNHLHSVTKATSCYRRRCGGCPGHWTTSPYWCPRTRIELSTPSLQGKCSTTELQGQKLVGVQGFEPWTLWSQTRCATRLRYTPILYLLTVTPGTLQMLSRIPSSLDQSFPLGEDPRHSLRCFQPLSQTPWVG